MPKRNVSFLGQSSSELITTTGAGTNSSTAAIASDSDVASSSGTGNLKLNHHLLQFKLKVVSPVVSQWRNYCMVVWSPKNKLMLQIELEECWSTDENYLRFKRIPFDESLVPQLTRRQQGVTNWPDESIIMLGVNVVKRGPPFTSKTWHLFWPDHQSFIEELADKITRNAKPRQPLPLLVYRGEEALKNFDKKGPPMAFCFEAGEDAVDDDYTGGKSMLRAYPGGPTRIPKPSLAR